MAIAIAYIGQRRFQATSQTNHQNFFNFLKSKHDIQIYDFIKDAPDSACPFVLGGSVQVWDFFKSQKFSQRRYYYKNKNRSLVYTKFPGCNFDLFE